MNDADDAMELASLFGEFLQETDRRTTSVNRTGRTPSKRQLIGECRDRITRLEAFRDARPELDSRVADDVEAAIEVEETQIKNLRQNRRR